MQSTASDFTCCPKTSQAGLSLLVNGQATDHVVSPGSYGNFIRGDVQSEFAALPSDIWKTIPYEFGIEMT